MQCCSCTDKAAIAETSLANMIVTRKQILKDIKNGVTEVTGRSYIAKIVLTIGLAILTFLKNLETRGFSPWYSAEDLSPCNYAENPE